MKDNCSACGVKPTRRRLMSGRTGTDTALVDIFQEITSLEVDSDEILCRNCADRLMNLHKNLLDFRSKCFFVRTSIQSSSSPLPPPSAPSIITPLKDITNTAHVPSTPQLTPLKPSSASSRKEPTSSTSSSSSSSSKTSHRECDHTYFHDKPVKSVLKKPKSDYVVDFSNIHVSDHDHSYHVESLKDMSIFDLPTIAREHFTKKVFASDQMIPQNVRNYLTAVLNNCNMEIFVKELAKDPEINNCFLSEITCNTKSKSETLGNKKRGFVSILAKFSVSSLENFDWASVVEEFKTQLPSLYSIIIGILDPKSPQHLTDMIPRIGFIYASIMQAKYPYLSLVQRLSSTILLDNICDQKVYDRLQKFGVCLSYQTSQVLLEELGGTYNTKVVDAVRNHRTVRLIGDNVQYTTGVYEQHFSNEGKTSEMHHAFASAFLINNFDFTKKMSAEKPQQCWRDVTPADFLLNPSDLQKIKDSYVLMMAKVASRFIPGLSFMSECLPQMTLGEHSQFLKEKTVVVPLETLPFNEQKYDEVVKILDFYETTLKKVHDQAGENLEINDYFHTGGDQLTRERFSGAKRLRADEDEATDRFEHLHPITFEFFHLLMNFLKVMVHYLYSEDSVQDVGTMKCEINRIKRTNFKENVNDAYDADKEFITSFTDSYIVELVLEFFGMETVYAKPTQNEPPDFITDDERRQWIYSTLGKMLDETVFEQSGHDFNSSTEEEVIEEASIITCTLANGQTIELKLMKENGSNESTKETDDHIRNYSLLVLQLGLLYKDLLNVCKIPDMNRIILLMKQCLVVFKAKSHLSKYALEILRFLMQVKVILSEQEAHNRVYGMFVNNHGKIDSHIPADLQMEYLVKLTKKHIKHMYSNKSEENIAKKTKALASVAIICEHYDNVSDIKVRSKKKQTPSYHDDELMMIEDLRSVRPFQKKAGRFHHSFKTIHAKIENYLEPTSFHNWIRSRIRIDGTDIAI